MRYLSELFWLVIAAVAGYGYVLLANWLLTASIAPWIGMVGALAGYALGRRPWRQRRRWIATPHGWVPEPTDDEFRQARANPGAMIERDAMPRARPGGESELPRREW